MGWLFGTLLLVLLVSWLGRRFLDRGPPVAVESMADLQETPPPPEAIGDTLDLHGVPPGDVNATVDAFLEVACSAGRRHVRIVHGKGIGVRRRSVRAHLARHPRVLAFGDAPPPSGWGATLVELAAPPVAPPRPSD